MGGLELVEFGVEKIQNFGVIGFDRECVRPLEHLQIVLCFAEILEVDGKAVSVIDLSGVEELTSKDVSAAENEVLKTGIYSANMKNFFVYSCALASRATGNPIEFFTKMPLVDAVKVRSTVNSASFFE